MQSPFVSSIDKPALRANLAKQIELSMYRFYQDKLTDDLITRTPVCDNFEQFVFKRKAEFIAGRMAACSAISKLLNSHNSIYSIGVNSDRSPIWPEGLIGSITHSKDLALAMVGNKTECKYLGVDLEHMMDEKLSKEVVPNILIDSELSLLTQSHLAFNIAVSLAFSAKESLFKALSPTTRQFQDFDAARIESIDVTSQQLSLELTKDWHEQLPKGSVFNCNFHLYDTYLISYVLV